MKTLIEVLNLAAKYLDERGVDSARLNTERLLAHVLKIERLELYLQFDRPLAEEELDSFRELTRRRVAGEPLQYILGRAGFRELSLQVGPGVLIPRPETERLVSLVLERMDNLTAGSGGCLNVLDLCAGSGAVGLSLAYERSGLWCLMAELTESAAGWAANNLQEYAPRLRSPVALLRCDLLEAVRQAELFDTIVANPPYVRVGDLPGLRAEVREHEPKLAPGAGPEGLDIIERIIAESADYLRPGGLLAIEIGETMRAAIERIFSSRAASSFQAPEFNLDLAGRLRFVTSYKTST